jgi:hypothetical protein
VILWWAGNALLALVALPIVLVEAFRIMRSLNVVIAAARDIATSVQSVAASVPAVATTVSEIASECGELELAVTR